MYGLTDALLAMYVIVAFVVEAYSALGLVDKDAVAVDAAAPVTAGIATPRTLVARSKVQFRREADAKFGNLIPIRLY